MPKINKKTSKTIVWLTLILSVIYVLIIAPQNTIIRVMSDTVDPYYWLVAKLVVVGVICLPFLVMGLNKVFAKKVRRDTFVSVVTSSVALITAPLAVYASQASFASVMALSFPVIFVVLSAWLLREKLTHRTIAGVALAMIGALVIILIPFAVAHQGTVFYPMGILLSLVNGVSSALATIYMRRTHQAGVPLMASVGLNAWVAALVSLLLFVLLGDADKTPTGGTFVAAVLYSAIGVSILARIVSVKLYEVTNSAFVGVIMYIQTFASIIIPVLLLGEVLSLPIIIGGLLMLIAVYIIESHKTLHFQLHGWHHR